MRTFGASCSGCTVKTLVEEYLEYNFCRTENISLYGLQIKKATEFFDIIIFIHQANCPLKTHRTKISFFKQT